MSYLKKIYDDAADKGPIDARKEDMPEYLLSVFMDIKEQLQADGFTVESGPSEISYPKGTGSRIFTVRPEGTNQFARESALYTLEIVPMAQRTLSAMFAFITHDVAETMSIKGSEVSFKLRGQTGERTFHYGANNKDTSVSRKLAREASINTMTEYIVMDLAQQNLGLRSLAKPAEKTTKPKG